MAAWLVYITIGVDSGPLEVEGRRRI